jgi:glucokinase
MPDWVIGVDLGGTKTAIGLIDPQNRIAGYRRMPTDAARGPVEAADRIARAVHELQEELPPGEGISALGICSPGPVDHGTGLIIDPPNLTGWRNVPFQEMLGTRLGIPIVLEHDAKTAALGEFHYGAGLGEHSMVYIVVGTGIGGGIIIDGELFRGRNNAAGELGHITIDRQGEVCSCGSRGCVETFASGPWLARRFRRKLESSHVQAPPEIRETTSGRLVAQLAREGNPLARQVMVEAGEALGAAIATTAMILDVELFVLGGSVSRSSDLFLEPACQAVPRHCFQSVASRLRIAPAALGNDGPLLGCAWLARQALMNTRGEPPW